MRKIVIRRPGSYERLELVEAPDPSGPGPGELLIEVQAAGINYADCLIRMGLYQSAKDYVGYPITPGFEYAGRVLAAGAGATRFKAGDLVFGVTRFGAYSSRLVVAERLVFSLPPQLDALTAAAFPAVFLTAYYPLFEMTKLRPGSRVLVHSAAGGVGGALVQLASKVCGCHVAAVVGASHKASAAKNLGAEFVIDKSQGRLWQNAAGFAPQGYDMVLDANGVETLEQSYEHLAPAGRLVIYGFHTMLPRQGGKPSWPKLAWDYLRTPRFNPLDLTTANKSILAFNLSYLFERQELLDEGLGRLTGWLAEGKLSPPTVTAFPVEKVADAHRALESGQTVGKLVLTFALALALLALLTSCSTDSRWKGYETSKVLDHPRDLLARVRVVRDNVELNDCSVCFGRPRWYYESCARVDYTGLVYKAANRPYAWLRQVECRLGNGEKVRRDFSFPYLASDVRQTDVTHFLGDIRIVLGARDETDVTVSGELEGVLKSMGELGRPEPTLRIRKNVLTRQETVEAERRMTADE